MRLSSSTVNKLRGVVSKNNNKIVGGGGGSTTPAMNIAAKAAAAANAASPPMQWPTYDPKDISPGILHVGVGNFHRSHLAAYMNDLFNTALGNNKRWGIVGTGVMPQEHDKRDLLKDQDWLQTLIERDGATDTTNASILAPMIDFTPIDYLHERDHEHFRDMLMNPDIKIVSLTVTEGGYFLNNQSELDLNHPAIQRDVANPEQPRTVFGLVVRALKQRMDRNMLPFTIMSCDNIPHNGHVTQSVVIELAQNMYGSELVKWIQEYGAFPNSMVDRITPAATQDTIDYIQEQFNYEDKAPILCEPFRQWVLEDVFVNGERPQWETLESVSVVEDVAPYENMKLRILNGGHASLCYPSALLGLQYVHEAIEHPVIGPFMDTLERKEIIPTLPPVPNTDLVEYWTIIAQRFANPTLRDTIARNCYDGTNRQPKFIIPVIKDALKNATSDDSQVVNGLALVTAMWSRYCQGVTEAGEVIPANDNDWDALQKIAMEAQFNPTAWLDQLPHVYGNVAENPIFRQAFTDALNAVNNNGVEAAMQAYIDANAAVEDVIVEEAAVL